MADVRVLYFVSRRAMLERVTCHRYMSRYTYTFVHLRTTRFALHTQSSLAETRNGSATAAQQAWFLGRKRNERYEMNEGVGWLECQQCTILKTSGSKIIVPPHVNPGFVFRKSSRLSRRMDVQSWRRRGRLLKPEKAWSMVPSELKWAARREHGRCLHRPGTT